LNRNEDLERAIRERDIESIVRMMFDPSIPSVKTNFRSEDELWDFKSDCPAIAKEMASAWAGLAKDILSFHNQRGGVIASGIRDDYSFTGATNRLDSKLVNDQVRKYLGDRIWIEFHREFIQTNQRYLGLALVPPRGPAIERFKSDAPEIQGIKLFKPGIRHFEMEIRHIYCGSLKLMSTLADN
jgi:schlafen family protein